MTSSSGTIKAIDKLDPIFEGLLSKLETSARLVCVEAEIPVDVADRVAARLAQVMRFDIQQAAWEAYKRGVARGEEDG
jgi:hypothetical protein